jgi:hypothetical protein
VRQVTYRLDPDGWIDQIFSARSARSGGVVRRSIAWIEREVGRGYFEEAVRKRQFHMVECGGQLVVICNSDGLKVIC